MAEQPSTIATTLATWVYLLHAAGTESTDAAVRGHCTEVSSAGDSESGDAAGLALVEAVAALVGGEQPDDVRAAASALFGDRLAGALGEGERTERTARIRRYQFAVGLPWLARIWQRSNGTVAPHWVIVERLTDEVHAMDPNPWDDIDEERHLPVDDFHVLWELDGCTAIHVDGA